mmetsp:Transcript_6660/g.18212  ORF Transcript_6660/g.18212 Transcript_6660/m.18212 type:complete len:224 (-) Transcript_6660:314-985(-)
MYGLRSINNMYAEHAGSRSDFIIVGHPEYLHGKVRSQKGGLGAGWDTKRAMHPSKCVAASRSFGTLVSELSAPEPWVTLKEKSQRRLQKDPADLSGSAGSLHRDFHAFVEHLNMPQAQHVNGRTSRTPLSFAKNKRHATVCRHFAARHEEIDDLREQMGKNPDATLRRLRESGAWKYYALQMEQDRRLKQQFERDRQRLEPSVRKAHSVPPAPVPNATFTRTA